MSPAVWLDKQSLRSGDRFDPKITRYITKECRCFVPIISTNTEHRQEGFFRQEWHLAAERDKRIFHGRAFIVPVVVDDTRKLTAVPECFEALHITWLPGGCVTAAFLEDLRRIVNGS